MENPTRVIENPTWSIVNVDHVLKGRREGIVVHLWRSTRLKATIHLGMRWMHNTSPQSCPCTVLDFTVGPPHWDQEALTFHIQSGHHGNDTKNQLANVAHNFCSVSKGQVWTHTNRRAWIIDCLHRGHEMWQIRKPDVWHYKFKLTFQMSWLDQRGSAHVFWVPPNRPWCMRGSGTWWMISDTGSWSTYEYLSCCSSSFVGLKNKHAQNINHWFSPATGKLGRILMDAIIY